MARVMISDAARFLEPVGRFAQAQFLQKDTDIGNSRGKYFGAFFVASPAQDQGIFMHGRAATGGVGQDGIEISRKRLEVAASKSFRGGQIPSVPGQAAAATLGARHENFDGVANEN